MDDGHLSIDNNRAERAIKPLVIGSKNWLFSNTPSGADTRAMLYSIIEIAKANGLILYNYMVKCMKGLAKAVPDIDAFLPWNLKPDRSPRGLMWRIRWIYIMVIKAGSRNE
ncbi:hypothetical protein BCT90_21965 [Vibrio lentus]|uniref:Transposase IS66 central domain-containing protein n=1 Tax=Vibrio lentus TaxID=136468 RepID=A0A2N7C093_9VIBR|nr:hypothetical protein BCV34_15480 [Vibrio lentus]PME67483.1 hypothetical protein BCV30_05310 [Vibrio lentus]PME92051.1 hypothetical protein BCV27_04535 [Vibrio lentus]PMG64361.1 hypothetical protein BCU86_18870 [Vibrio lentus]PMH94017.1 hypothetical protein BCU56_04630 [Vibrio lentus]